MQSEDYCSLRFENSYGVFLIEKFKECDFIEDLIADLIVPMLQAAGYSNPVIEEYIKVKTE